MALATQCPYCHTCFRVANDQLKLHAGIVRCGSCQQTFNGIAQLLSPEQTQDLINGKAPIPKEEKRPIPVEHVATTIPADVSQTPATSHSNAGQVTAAASDAEIGSKSAETSTQENALEAASLESSVVASAAATQVNTTDAAPAHKHELEDLALSPSVLEPDPVIESATHESDPVAPTSLEQKSEASAPQVWKTRSQAELISSETKDTSIVNATNKRPELEFETEFKTEIKPELEPEFTQAPPTSKTSSAFDLDFEFDEPLEPISGRDHKPPTSPENNHEQALTNSHDLDFEIELTPPVSAQLSTERSTESAEQTEDFAAPLVTEAVLTTESSDASNQEPNLNSNEFLALQKASKNQEPNFDTESALDVNSIPLEFDQKLDQELDKLDAKLNENLTTQLDALDAPSEDEKPSFILHAERLEKRKRWRLLSYLLLFILCVAALAQASYLFRNEIVAHYPASKPHMQKACAVLKCSIQMPAQKEAFIFLADELITLSVEKKLFQLAVQLQNNSSTVQQWPHLLLTLNDQQGKPLLKRTFAPKEYLSDAKELQQGFAARTDIAIKLHFELKTINASNYRVEVIYP